MRRALGCGLPSPHPFLDQLPGLFQDDDFTRRLTQALDEVLVPVIMTLDCLPAYLDPALAPVDFVRWLAEWVGLPVDEAWPEARRRDLVAAATRLHGARGTLAGLCELLELLTGTEVEVSDSGGTSWSCSAGSELPGTAEAEVVVRVRGLEPAALGGVETLVAAARPAHVRYRVEVRGQP